MFAEGLNTVVWNSEDLKREKSGTLSFPSLSYKFADTAKALQEYFPEVLNMNNISGSLKADFRAVKIGDINDSALKESPQVRSVESFQIEIAEMEMIKGQEYSIGFSTRQLPRFVGYQFTLSWNRQLADFLEILPARSSKENFGLFTKDGLLTTTYFGETASGDTLFYIRMKALSNCRASEIFSVNSRITPVEAYQTFGDITPVELLYSQNAYATNGFELWQNIPNPFSTETQINFILPEACEATIVIQDISGRAIKTFNGMFAEGLNTVVWNSEDLKREKSGTLSLGSGIFFYTLTTNSFSQTRKMVRIE